jgi:hypothetical protein
LDQPTHKARRKHHVIYKTTCLVTGKWYVGMHSTNDLNDGYIGSGKRLWYSIKKYGKSQHRCEILEHHPDRTTLALREEEILTPELKADPLCLNIAKGGLGHHPGWYTTAEGTRIKLSEAMKAHHASAAGEATKQRLREFHTGRIRPPEVGAKISVIKKAQLAANPVGPQSEERKKQVSEKMLGKPKPAEHVANMRAACLGRRKVVREDGSWFWGRQDRT